MPCYLVHTNGETHRIIRATLHRSPIAPGAMDALGPRYCPSIEEKIVRFAHKDAHQLFLEPEGFSTGEVYVQGMFTGLPFDVQLEMLHSIPALADAEMMRPGYAIEYDYVPPYQTQPSLESRVIHGLFLGGQINGTSGYEEAAAQGLLAGINAACYVRDEAPLMLRRDEAYLGVLVDDLITKDLTEPYRLMTSRAEYRLVLRSDNADLRLTPAARRLGLVDEARWQAVEAKRAAVAAEIERLAHCSLPATAAVNARLRERGLEPLAQAVLALQFLRRPGADYDIVAEFIPPATALSAAAAEQVSLEVHFEGYIDKQKRQVARARACEERHIPLRSIMRP